MNIKEKIEHDLKDAQKQGNALRVSVLRMLCAALHNKEIEKRTRLSKQNTEDIDKASRLIDEEIVSVIQSETKKRRESVEAFEKGGRKELAEKEKNELAILQSYLPAQLSEAEIRKIVEHAIKKTGVSNSKDKGLLMKELMPLVKGRADGQTVNKIVEELLG